MSISVQVSSTASSHTKTLAALEKAIAGHSVDQPVILDLDETLWLRNSTETFLANAKPASLIVALLAFIDLVAPWQLARLTGMDRARARYAFRDWLRVICVMLLTPWNVWTWRHRANTLGQQYVNRDLLAALQATCLDHTRSCRLWVATLGFSPIVSPLVQSILPQSELCCAPIWAGWRFRLGGKARALKKRMGGAELEKSIFVTDSERLDHDVIESVPQSFVIKWPEARFEVAGVDRYLPFRYTFRGKHAGRNHVLRVFIGEDWLVLVMASALAASSVLPVIIAYLLLMLSFFIVFEIGYHENDNLGKKFETSPHLTSARLANLHLMQEKQAWIWALLAGAPGIWLVTTWNTSQFFTSWATITNFGLLMLLWAGVLITTRVLFGVFNRITEISRCLLYLPLQFCKGLLIVIALGLPLAPAGAALLTALPLSRWVPYVIYRYTGQRGHTPVRLFRLLLFLLIVPASVHNGSTGLIFSFSGWMMLVWCVFTARHELVQAFDSLKRIDRSG